MVPIRLLPQQVTVVRPLVTNDEYGNQVYDYGTGATRITVPGWLQQDRRTERSELRTDGRDPLVQRWLLVTNHQDVQGRDRVEWAETPAVFEVEGPPEPAYDPSGFHHTEATLRVVEG